MLLWSQQAFVYGLSLSLLHSLWQGAVLGMAGFLLHLRLKRVTPDIRCGGFSLLLFLFFVVWLGTFGYLYVKAIQPLSLPVDILNGPVFPQTAILPSAFADSSVARPLLQFLSPWLVVCWAGGVCLLSLRHLGGFLLLCHLCRTETAACLPAWETYAAKIAARMGIRRKIVLRCSTRLDVPCVFGLSKSYILLPLSVMLRLPPEQAEALIAHELAHIARHDVFFNLVQVCMETVLFYHPLVWWLSMQIRTAREQCCDDLAVSVVGDRALYAHALYSLEEARATIPQLALGARGDNSKMMNGNLIQRIQRVLGVSSPEKRDPWAKGALALCTATIGLAALMPIRAYSRPAGQDTNPPAEKHEMTVKVVHRAIILNINGDKIELNTTDLKPDTRLKVNGKEGRFSDLTPQQQKQLQEAVKALPAPPDPHTMVFKMKEGTGDKHITVLKSGHTQILLNINGDKIELNTMDLKPETPVTINGKVSRFSDLPPQQQKELRDALKAVPSVSGKPGNVSKMVQSNILLNIKGDKFELQTTDIKPDTPVTLNGKESRFSALTPQQQKEIQEAIAGIHIKISGETPEELEAILDGVSLSEEDEEIL